MAMKIKAILSRWWINFKASYQRAKIREEARIRTIENSISHHHGVNPSTGMPMISKSVDCMGTPFGLSDWSRRH